MPKAKIIDTLNQLAELKCFFLTLLGGEPLLHNELDKILNETDRLNFAIDIMTNGTLINSQMLSMLTDHNIQAIFIPLFGATAKIHDEFVGYDGAFNKVINSISLLKKTNIRVGVRSFITSKNFSEWKNCRKLILDLGADYLPTIQIHKSCDNFDLQYKSLRINNEQIRELFNNQIQMYYDHECTASISRCDIQVNGDVTACSLLTKPFGNLYKESLQEIWNNSEELHSMRKIINSYIQNKNYENDKAYRCTADALFDDGSINAMSTFAADVVSISKEFK